ncbi:CRISPR-associated protein Cas4 [Martelella alba]|uniref:CRISPR-associated exonuclease Cas4 n=1 Tax=Martelella alba TaxID=2590451 RepID=A0A506UCK8_9HYPH|nr:CRISPR-associated protein Cas4 [Martelella alba]TPW32172.1 CRISPR-associated protein Cas4 [Martelella alba]
MADESRLSDPVPISALQHAVYCLRQAALIHIEQVWAENRFTAEGDVLHAVADKGGKRKARGLRRVMALPVASRRLNISGIADMVEFQRDDHETETPFPVEYKRGKAKLHRADEVQLCAQALCLEEMTGSAVPEGALFYGETKRRVAVPFDADLRGLTEETISAFAAIRAAGKTPPPTEKRTRCRACSLVELCRPEAFGRPVRAWRRRQVDGMADEGG